MGNIIKTLSRILCDVDDDALYWTFFNQSWEESRDLLTRRDSRRLLRYRDEKKRSPLSMASNRNAPLDIVKSICNMDLQQVLHQDYDKNTPLCYACAGASEKVLMFLLYTAPQAAAIPDIDGRLPLHWAIEFRRSPTIIKKLLEIHPTAIYASDILGCTPLNLFFRRSMPELINEKSSVSRVDVWSLKNTMCLLTMAHAHRTINKADIFPQEWLPLHEVLQITKTPKDYLLFGIQAMREKLPTQDSAGNFPLHILCSTSPVKINNGERN